MPTHSALLRLTRRAALLATAGFSLSALAQLSPPVIGPDKPLPPPVNWQPPRIQANLSGGQPVQLREALVDVQVLGGQAQTRVELRIYNPNARVLEGELQFPLLDGQVVTGFALDVGGRLRDAVPVPKARGQEIFEDIRRRRVDPGLLEATAANQYKLRVYPIPANGERRVALTFTETLPRQASGANLLRLPLAFADVANRLQVQVHANGISKGDAQLLQAPPGAQLQWDAAGMHLLLQREQWTAPAGAQGWLQLTVRDTGKEQWLVGESAGQRFFSGALPFKDEPVPRAEPKHVALVWDASGSAASQNRVLPVLEAYFRSLRQPVKVSLQVVRNRPEPVRVLTVAPGEFGALAKLLRDEPFDGASNFDNLPIPRDADITVMVTDGLMTDGQRLINYTHTAPVLVVNGAASADLPRLRRLAERTGGALVDATQMNTAEAVQAMRTDGWRVRSLDSLSAKGLVAPSLRVQNGRIALAGELTDSEARMDLVLVHPSGRSRTLHVAIDGRKPQASRWPAQQWAQWRSAELAENPSLHKAELERIAAQHGMVGPNSSLIVLELAADYARFNLRAPPELAGEVARLAQLQISQNTQRQQAHLEAMVRQFDTRQQWWDKSYAKDAPAKPVQPQQPQISGGLGNALRADTRRARDAGPAMEQDTAPAERRPAAPMAVAPVAAPTTAFVPPPPPMAMAKSAARSEATGGSSAASTAPANTSIALQAWSPDTPYLKRLRELPAAQLYRVYLDERQAYLSSSAFYLDVAGLFFERGLNELGLRILSNLAEMNLENRQLLRLYAYRLLQARQPALAVPVFERVAQLAPNEPQSWRDLGLALAEQGEPQRAVNALWEVVSRPWDGRFAGVNMIALAELNAIAAQQQAQGHALDMSRVDARLRRNLPLALRVVMAWDTDDTDVDLWVTDPNAEKAYYGHRLTYQGGAMSPDATGGYGPEEFALKEAKPGKYVVQAQFYGNRQQVLSAGTTVMVRVTTGFGTPQAKDEWTSLRLVTGKETNTVAEIEIK